MSRKYGADKTDWARPVCYALVGGYGPLKSSAATFLGAVVVLDDGSGRSEKEGAAAAALYGGRAEILPFRMHGLRGGSWRRRGARRVYSEGCEHPVAILATFEAGGHWSWSFKRTTLTLSRRIHMDRPEDVSRHRRGVPRGSFENVSRRRRGVPRGSFENVSRRRRGVPRGSSEDMSR